VNTVNMFIPHRIPSFLHLFTKWKVFGYPAFSAIYLRKDSLDLLTFEDLNDNHLWRGEKIVESIPEARERWQCV
jgi:hypothetical protein